jgi:tripartite-type tricarboxylate transporter receptor subunit TctC
VNISVRLLLPMSTALTCLAGACSAVAQPSTNIAEYPNRAIRIIVPFAPQGPNDLLARLIGHRISEAWSQPVVIENRPGAGTIIGTEAAARASGDGYTLLMVSTSTAVNPSLRKTLPYDTLRDFVPVARLAESPNVLVVHPSVPVRSVGDLLRLAKQKPGSVAYASGGMGTATHLAGALLTSMSGTSMTHVPYKGAGPATTDLLGGQVSWMFGAILPTMPYVESKRLRVIAVSGPRRSSAMPEIPTVAETLPGFDATSWWGIFAPAGTPKDIVAKLNAQIARILATQEIRDQFRRQGVEPIAETPEAFAAYFASEIKKWAEVVRTADIKAE